MTTCHSDRERDVFFCNLSRQNEISKIIREDKESEEKETIYLSGQAELRERTGITKMFAAAGMELAEELGVTTCTIQRDIQTLSPGFLVYTRQGGIFIVEYVNIYGMCGAAIRTRQELPASIFVWKCIWGILKSGIEVKAVSDECLAESAAVA